ncbi:MAG TPA: cation diffusion facilitator family transporter [Bacteroidales bacterium]|nr:cation diffusion facilitator family transporter [Bacteroidales bacterium]HPS17364.1 cation diffusion facilitator family transporter [Bacteroidales bacterium]
MNKKAKTARLSILSNTFLIIMKIIAGILSGSVSIISEAIHSLMDLVAAVIAFLSVRVSDKAPDEKHPYGHGKYENISGVLEGLLIFVAAIWIIYEAIQKIVLQNEIEELGIGFFVMFISSVVNYIVSRRLYKVAKETDSIALEADALHLKVDVYTSLGVAVGLALIWITDYHILDPLIAILVATFILRESFILLKNAYSPLLDVKLPDEEIEIIKESIKSKSSGVGKFHQLRTRNAGHLKYVDLHLEVPENLSVQQAHDICDLIEKDIESKIPNIEVSIHVEPLKK